MALLKWRVKPLTPTASQVIKRLHALFNRREISVEPVNLNELVEEGIALSLTSLQRNQVVVRSEFAEDLPPVMGDRVQLQQITINLLRSGSDAMTEVDDPPRHLVVRTGRDDRDRARLGVTDVGDGFHPQAAKRLFESFCATKADGMGIGLAVGKSIMEHHHGRLWVELNDGPGSTLSFSIPFGHERM